MQAPVLAMVFGLAGSVAVIAGDLGPVSAEAPVAVATHTPSSLELSFTLRGGVAVTPDYFGSKTYSVGPDLGFGLNALSLGRINIGSTDPHAEKLGFGVHGSFRYIDKRKVADHAELAAVPGVADVKAAAELGFGVAYTARNFSAFTDIRYGVIGHHAFAGEMGADLILRPSDRVKVTLGPRAQFGSGKFAQTYFGTAAFAAKGGLLGVGAELGVTYALNDDWGIEGAATYTRLKNSAAASPITGVGSKDQYSVRLGLTRRFTFGF
jgi:outer membrane protein